jgi:hypothetical protein
MQQRPENTITEVTRKAIVDYLSIGPQWSGSLPENDFLGHLYDLKAMKSTDHRPDFDNAAKDIWQHRVRNFDWPDNWVFTDERFDLLFGSDEAFLKFLVHTIHPLARLDVAESRAMAREYNSSLGIDGWEIYAAKSISGKAIYSYRLLSDSSSPHLEEASKVAEKLSGHHIGQQIRRLRDAVGKDPELAIGTAKEFLESLCKEILSARNMTAATDVDFPALVRTTVKTLSVIPPALAANAHSEKAVMALLGNLSAIGHQMAELRNQFGTGHGRSAHHVGLEKRHAKLVVGAATTLAVFLYESHEADFTSPL